MEQDLNSVHTYFKEILATVAVLSFILGVFVG